jgi:hypothetical protein
VGGGAPRSSTLAVSVYRYAFGAAKYSMWPCPMSTRLCPPTCNRQPLPASIFFSCVL